MLNKVAWKGGVAPGCRFSVAVLTGEQVLEGEVEVEAAVLVVAGVMMAGVAKVMEEVEVQSADDQSPHSSQDRHRLGLQLPYNQNCLLRIYKAYISYVQVPAAKQAATQML